jgi:hypothetical protein
MYVCFFANIHTNIYVCLYIYIFIYIYVRTLWNAQLFPVTSIPNLKIKKEKNKTDESEGFLYLFILQYLKSDANKEVSNDTKNNLSMAIKVWSSKRKLSLYDLLSYGDARKMHNWRQYLHNIQERTNSGRSYLLNGICVSRCEVGGFVSRVPSNLEVYIYTYIYVYIYIYIYMYIYI